MADQVPPEESDKQAADRRAFLARAGQVAVVAPAAALLLSATTANAQSAISGALTF